MSEDWKITWKREYDKTWDKISKIIFKKSPLCHWASLIRISDFNKIGFYYNEKFARAHDYELWSRFYGNWFKLAILNRYFLSYRIFPWQWKSKHLKITLWNTIKIQSSLIFKYRKIPTFSWVLYLILEILLLSLPSNIVLFLFKKISKIN